VKEMIRRHQQFTGSDTAAGVLDDWEGFLKKCIKVMPTDYKRVLEQMKSQQQAATT